MEAKDYVISDVLSGNRQFLVPIYQRRYQWTDSELLPFWADVAAKSDEVLEDRSRYQHYLGALIWVAAGDGLTARINIVDGQQRLTTIQLMLAAFREVSVVCGHESLAARIEPFLFNGGPDSERPPSERVKIVSTPADRGLIQDIIGSDSGSVRRKYPDFYFQNGNLRAGQAPRALANYLTLLRLVERYIRSGVAGEYDEGEIGSDGDVDRDLKHARLSGLFDALLHNLKVVVIALGDGDDAQVIFETLNSKGRPLRAMDLVKNNIFHRAEAQGEAASELYRQLWSTFEGDFWEMPAPRARPVRPRIDHFLSHSLAAQTGKQTAIKELYAEYRGFARPNGRPRFETVEEELEALTQYAPTYRSLEGDRPGRTALAWIGSKLAAWESTIAYPITFQLSVSGLNEQEKALGYRLLYSYIVRRAICRLPNKSHGQALTRVSSRLLDDGPSVEAIIDVLEESAAPTLRFPQDEEFSRALVSNPIYEWFSGGRLPDLLWELELASRNQFTEAVGRPDALWVEHVMPQTWTDAWPDADGSPVILGGSEERTEKRARLIHTIGNLTLTTDSLNMSLGNESFSRKLAKLEAHSILQLNKKLRCHAEWSEREIEARSQELAMLACSAFPSGDAARAALRQIQAG